MLYEKLLNTNCFYDNEYLRKYVDLIENDSLDSKIKYKTQVHHILPKCYFKYVGKEVDNSCNNLVILYHKDHILAHAYLALCFSVPELASSNKFSVLFALTNSNNIQDEQYLLSKEFLQDLDCYQQLMEIKCIRKPLTGQQKQNLSKAQKGKKLSQEHKDKIGKYQREYWSIHERHIDQEIREKISKSVSEYNQDLKLNHADLWEQRNTKISEALVGKEKSEDFKKNLSESRVGDGNPMFGKHHTEEYKRKRSEQFSGDGNPMFGKHLTEEQKHKAVSTRIKNGSYCKRKFINNGKVNKFVRLDELDSFLSDGWVIGKLYDQNRKQEDQC